ncbi:MAG: MaoC family dehydratase [Candidatus Krumholzibacteriota bacterium]|nr:MaoC family dehydratase [Candidatus Krumholzibacteriota bacterium]
MDERFGRYFEDFKEGEVIKHWPCKTVTESDNNLFCLLTMNHHPVHLDTEYCKTQHHGKILVVGTYVLSLVVGMSVADISGRAIANLDYEKVTHDGPVFIGDTLCAQTGILEVRESAGKPDRGIIYVETEAFNQDDGKVLSLRRHILVPKRSRTNA